MIAAFESKTSYLKKFLTEEEENNVAETEEEEEPAHELAIGRTKKNFYYLSSEVVHRYIGGQTGAGKTTLAQSMIEIDFLKGRKIVEIEPALEAKNERVFMNMPNNDEGMLKVLEEYFNVEPRPFKVVCYTIETPRYKSFIRVHPEAEEFYKSIKLTEADVIDVLPYVFPAGGSTEASWVLGRYKEYIKEHERRDDRTIQGFMEHLKEKGEIHVFTRLTQQKILDTAFSIFSEGKFKIEDILKRKDEISVFTTHFIDDPIDRYIFASTVLHLIYHAWKRVKRKEDILSFFVADAHLLAPAKQKDVLERLKHYQISMRQNLQMYVRISRGQGISWTFDSQELDDLDTAVVSQCSEIFIKRMKNPAVAEKYKIQFKKLKSLDKKHAYFDNGFLIAKILVRPPMSRKASQGEFLPIHFIKEYERWRNEENNY